MTHSSVKTRKIGSTNEAEERSGGGWPGEAVGRRRKRHVTWSQSEGHDGGGTTCQVALISFKWKRKRVWKEKDMQKDWCTWECHVCDRHRVPRGASGEGESSVPPHINQLQLRATLRCPFEPFSLRHRVHVSSLPHVFEQTKTFLVSSF